MSGVPAPRGRLASQRRVCFPAGTAMSRVPVTILSGFLGSGKTTRLNELLRAPHGRRLAVVVNEFGAVGIDASRLAGPGEFVELDGGCLCCALNADLEATLQRLRDRGGFDHLVLETSGVADPLPVAWTFGRNGLAEAFRVDAIVTVVDAAQVAALLAGAPEAREQIERADLLLITMLDLVTDGGQEATAAVRAYNAAAPIVPSPRGDVPWSLVLGLTPGAPSRADGAAPAHAGPHAHDRRFESWTWRAPGLVSDTALEDLLRAPPAGVYRVKGVLHTDAPWGWSQVDGVGGRYEIAPADPPPARGQGILVCIGRDLDRAALHAAATRLLAARDPTARSRTEP